MKKGLFLILITLIVGSVHGQGKWPVPIYFEKYGVYHHLSNSVSLNDTAIIMHSENIFFKIVLYDAKGRLYFESYKNNKLHEKGSFENSLDTLKKYIIAVGGKNDKRIKLLQYFHPLKNGIWFETIKGKLVKKEYNMGIEIQ
jgi:hypothetical protein